MTAIVIVDAFWGDGGKGLFSSHIALRENALGVFRGGVGPNAEHGMFVNGDYLKTNQLPLGFILQNCLVGIGPGTAVDPEKFFSEISRFGLNPNQVKIDPRCPIITLEHKKIEETSSHMKNIGSTKSGSGACMADFARRKAPQARNIKALEPYLLDIPLLINELARKGKVIVESSQGTLLSRSFSYDYPNATSADVTTPATIASVGLNWKLIEEVIMIVKALPTREGTGSMGNVRELTIEEMKERNLIEYSSIGGEIRRKASEIDENLLKYVCMLNGPTQIALSFAEHWDPEVKDAIKWVQITQKVKGLIKKIERFTNVPVRLINTGKNFTSMVSIDDDLPKIDEKMMQRLVSYLQA